MGADVELQQCLQDAENTIAKLLCSEYGSTCQFCVYDEDKTAQCARIGGSGQWCERHARWNQQRSAAHWEVHDAVQQCSHCRFELLLTQRFFQNGRDIGCIKDGLFLKYCPNCGARMEDKGK